jgi:hypothetical protein
LDRRPFDQTKEFAMIRPQLTSLVLITGIAGSVILQAGPLLPPAGPISPTGRFSPRVEIDTLPFAIVSPGSYYLGKSLFAAAGTGIDVFAGDVTIDLQGWDLVGGAGSATAIMLHPGAENVTVHNGKVRGWMGVAVDMTLETGHHVYDLQVTDNFNTGLIVGAGSTIEHVVSRDNAGIGIAIGTGSVAANCTAAKNGADGFWCEDAVRLTDCTSTFNGTAGAFGTGFTVAGMSSMSGCTARSNITDGFIATGPANSIANSTAFENGSGGLGGSGFLGFQSVINCVAEQNATDGIVVFEGTVKACSALANAGTGIVAFGSTVTDSTANANGTGILAEQSLIRSNTTNGNITEGILAGFGNQLRHNSANFNAANGIFVIAEGNLIEANHLVFNGLAAIDTVTAAGGIPNAVMSNREHANPGGYALDFGSNTWGTIAFGPGTVTTGALGDQFSNVSY